MRSRSSESTISYINPELFKNLLANKTDLATIETVRHLRSYDEPTG